MLKKCHDRAGIIFCQTFGFKYADYLERTDRSAVNPGGVFNRVGKVYLPPLAARPVRRLSGLFPLHRSEHKKGLPADL